MMNVVYGADLVPVEIWFEIFRNFGKNRTQILHNFAGVCKECANTVRLFSTRLFIKLGAQDKASLFLQENLPLYPNVQILKIQNASLDDNILYQISQLNKLRHLKLKTKSKINFYYFSSLTRLSFLHVGFTQVGNKDLMHVSNLTTLKRINLASTQVTDEGLIYLSNLTQLCRINLSGNRNISDDGLKFFSHFKEVTALNLSSTRITNKVLAHLSGFSKLTSLNLSHNQLNCEADLNIVYISIMSKFTNLFKLNLSYTNINDFLLVHLNKLSRLKKLNLKHTKSNIKYFNF